MIFLFLALGGLVGFLLAAIVLVERADGTIKVDASDPDEDPYVFLELNEYPTFMKRRNFVIFRVDPNDYVTRK